MRADAPLGALRQVRLAPQCGKVKAGSADGHRVGSAFQSPLAGVFEEGERQ